MTPCPGDLKLEAHLLAPSSSAVADHVGSCPGCQSRLAEMRLLSDDFRCQVYPATVDGVLDSLRPRRWLSFLLHLAPMPALAAAAVLMLLVVPRDPPDGYVGTKGAPFSLSAFTHGLDGARPLEDGGRVPADAALRFAVHIPGSACRLWLVSVDETRQASRLYPVEGEGGAAIDQPGPLPGGAILDGRVGPERLFAVCSPQPIQYATVVRAAREAVSGGPDAVRLAKELRGLPSGVFQATLLLEKTR